MKVWLYYRLSRDEDEELNSLNNQRKIIYNFAVSNGHEVVGESFDDNVSGMHFNRDAGERPARTAQRRDDDSRRRKALIGHLNRDFLQHLVYRFLYQGFHHFIPF